MKIMPFICAKCGVSFSYDEGGKCNKCDKFFCSNHLFEVKAGKDILFYCEADKGDLKGKIRKNELLKIREKLGAKKS